MTCINRISIPLLFCSAFILGCDSEKKNTTTYDGLLNDGITLCGTADRIGSTPYAQFLKGKTRKPFDASIHPRLLDALSDLPLITANDNRVPAGKLVDGVLQLDLEITWGDFRVETIDRTGLRVAAIAESGKAPSVPGPLIRAEKGTIINVQVKNTLKDSTITVYGLQSRPANSVDSLVIKPGETKSAKFEAGDPGNYFYSVKIGVGLFCLFCEETQVAGALIIDPIGGSPPDRVFVINIFSQQVDSAIQKLGYLSTLTLNGRSWPFTERQRPTVGDTLRWRIINVSHEGHPMHLHGFFYNVTSLGSIIKDSTYNKEDQPYLVTQFMPAQTTMGMEWVPTRPGNWLFHCHLSFHVESAIRLPGSEDEDDPGCHMAGLVLGIEVPPGPTDLISKGEPSKRNLYAVENKSESGYTHGFSFSKTYSKPLDAEGRIGPLLLLKQYQTTYMTVQNNMSIPTSIHWHGLEIDSWADGVPNWSYSNGMVSPALLPGKDFTYKLSSMRAGSFIYHSHLDDVNQLTDGLYGPLIVIGENDTYNPVTDHYYIIGWKNPDPMTRDEIELNGRSEDPPIQQAVVGETHRIRLMHIAPASEAFVGMTKNGKPVPIRFVAKDGADVPERLQVLMDESPGYGVGETADFSFTPTEPGTYELVLGYRWLPPWKQTWIVLSNKLAAKTANASSR